MTRDPLVATGSQFWKFAPQQAEGDVHL